MNGSHSVIHQSFSLWREALCLIKYEQSPSFPPPCPAHTSLTWSHALHMLTYGIISHTGYGTSWGSVSGWKDCADDAESMGQRMSCEYVSAQRKSSLLRGCSVEFKLKLNVPLKCAETKSFGVCLSLFRLLERSDISIPGSTNGVILGRDYLYVCCYC